MKFGHLYPYFAYACALFGAVLIMYSIPIERAFGAVKEMWFKKVADVDANLTSLHIEDYEASQLVMMAVALALTIFFGGILLGYFVSAIGLAVLILISDKLYFPWAQAKLREEFDEKFPMALDQIVSSTRAGLNLAQAMEDVSRFAPHPIDGELQKIVRENRMGSDMATALTTARERLKSHTLGLTVSALLVNMRQGGDLPKALERMSQALKEIWRLEQKIFTASAEARKGAMVMSAMPVVIFLMVASMQPEMIDKLTGTLMGFGILVLAAVLYAGGMAWMFRIIKTDV